MSYYFAIVGTQDNPLFEYEFGTSKQGGDGQSKFTDQVRHLNQIILHSSLDVAEEVQWSHGQMCVSTLYILHDALQSTRAARYNVRCRVQTARLQDASLLNRMR